MKVFLVRHGDYVHPDYDSSKPLSPKGEADVTNLGKWLKEQGHCPSKIFHSGVKRANQTADILSREMECSAPQEVENLKPNSEVNFWGDKLEEYSEDIMLVGHMPYMGDLVTYLTTGDCCCGFNTSEVICLEKKMPGHWQKLWAKCTS